MILLKVNRGRMSGSNDENHSNAVTINWYTLVLLASSDFPDLTSETRYIHFGVHSVTSLAMHLKKCQLSELSWVEVFCMIGIMSH